MLTHFTTDNQTSCSTFNESRTERFSSNLSLVVSLSVIAVVTDVFTVLFNFTLIIALCRYKTTRGNHHITKTVVTSMAVVDLCISLFSAPFGLLFLIDNGNWRYGLMILILWQSYSYFLVFVSACHIFSMALDKYIAVCHPTRYRILPHKYAYLMIGLSWLVPIISQAILFILGQNIYANDNRCLDGNLIGFLVQSSLNIIMTYSSSILATPIVLSYLIYFFIFVEIHQWIKRPEVNSHLAIDKVLHQNIFKISESLVLLKLPLHNREVNRPQMFAQFKTIPNVGGRRSGRAIRTIGSILAAYTICWIPSLVNLILLSQSYQIPIQLYIIAQWIGYLSTLLNPLLCLGIGFVRLALRKMSHIKINGARN